MSLFVGRLPTFDFDDRDLEDIFYKYGRIVKCQLKRGSRFCKLFIYKEGAVLIIFFSILSIWICGI